MKNIIICLSCLILPSFVLRSLLGALGCPIGKQVKIGFSVIWASKLELGNQVKIGSFNFIKVDSMRMDNMAYINHFNFIRGPIEIILMERAAIGKNNIISRAPLGISHGSCQLYLGKLSKITAYHFIDLTKSIRFGDYSTLAGIRSQLWTHGYVHAATGAERFRVDGEIKIGNNVYIGSGVLINPGVNINDTINIGGNSTISKDLIIPGMYVNQPLRHLDKSFETIKSSLKKVEVEGLIEDVYEK